MRPITTDGIIRHVNGTMAGHCFKYVDEDEDSYCDFYYSANLFEDEHPYHTLYFDHEAAGWNYMDLSHVYVMDSNNRYIPLRDAPFIRKEYLEATHYRMPWMYGRPYSDEDTPTMMH